MKNFTDLSKVLISHFENVSDDPEFSYDIGLEHSPEDSLDFIRKNKDLQIKLCGYLIADFVSDITCGEYELIPKLKLLVSDLETITKTLVSDLEKITKTL